MSDPVNYVVWLYDKYSDKQRRYLRAYKLERHALLFARGAASVARLKYGKIYVEYPLGYFVEVK